LLWLALQLLRPAHRRAGPAAAARPCRPVDRAGLRTRAPHCLARPYILACRQSAATLLQWRLRRTSRLMESPAAERLQGRVRAVCRGPPGRRAGRRIDRISRRGRATRSAARLVWLWINEEP